jgi:hypothetical protein
MLPQKQKMREERIYTIINILIVVGFFTQQIFHIIG